MKPMAETFISTLGKAGDEMSWTAEERSVLKNFDIFACLQAVVVSFTVMGIKA